MSEKPPTRYADVASWELPDSLWERIEPWLPKGRSRYRGRGKQRKNIGGRPIADRRKVMAGILYVLRTGCQWNASPKATYGSGKTAHKYFQRWGREGVFKRMWQAGLTDDDALKGIAWKWQAAGGGDDQSAAARDRKNRAESDGSRQAGHEAECAGR